MMIDAILSCFNLNRGIKLVLEPFREHLFHNTFVRPALTFADRRDKVKDVIEHDFAVPRRALLDLTETKKTPEDKNACIKAINGIFEFLALLREDHELDDQSARYVQQWPIGEPSSAACRETL